MLINKYYNKIILFQTFSFNCLLNKLCFNKNVLLQTTSNNNQNALLTKIFYFYKLTILGCFFKK